MLGVDAIEKVKGWPSRTQGMGAAPVQMPTPGGLEGKKDLAWAGISDSQKMSLML